MNYMTLRYEIYDTLTIVFSKYGKRLELFGNTCLSDVEVSESNFFNLETRTRISPIQSRTPRQDT